ncbi:MAG: hypothetical protein CM1200mP10_28330 [Candidatus Neomarinimicrobiota bacterium]|nr:MAG: hypothetical protein CM1200mP10_28330 [Candidatus Neomarinimicrobiota bacterium]
MKKFSMDDASPSTSYYPTMHRATGDSALEQRRKHLADCLNDVKTLIGIRLHGMVIPQQILLLFILNISVYMALKKIPGFNPDAITGNLVYDSKAFSVKVGTAITNKDSRGDLGESLLNSQGDYPYSYTLLNANNTPWYESKTQSMYANFTIRLGSTSFAKVNLSSYNFAREYGDHRHKAKGIGLW